MQCVILAGGLGTRMWPLTEQLPKALIPVNGVPFAHRQLELLTSEGITEVVYSIGFRGDMIEEVVGDGARWGITVRYVNEGEPLRGTAGALRVAFDAGVLDRDFMVLYGDSYLPIAYGPVVDAFHATDQPALMTILRNDDRWGASNVRYADGRIITYDKQRRSTGSEAAQHIDYGLSVVDRALVEASVEPGEIADLADLYHRLSLDGRLAGFEVTERFYEVGSPTGLADLEAHLRGL